MANTRIALMVIGVLLIAQAATPQLSIIGRYNGGLKPSDDELKEIFKEHDAWVKDGGPYHLNDSKVANDPRRANLSNANLNQAHLVGAHLEGAYLESADLSGADLLGAHLEGADLLGA